jgi:LysM repeat protein/ABC-type branched-subunit amino acid transport system substrate-binding protein
MERRIANIIICGLVALMTAGTSLYQTAGAQEYVAPPVSISKDKVKIDGKVFYSHIVLEKQTLFSISKAYNVSIEEIYRYNPSVKEGGLKKNAIINIPVTEERQEEQPLIQGGRTHTVKWYEDLSSIASRYNVSEEAIARANNLKDNKVRNKQVLIIPVEEPQTAPVISSTAEEQVETPELSQIEKRVYPEEENTDLDQYSDTLFIIDYWNKYIKNKVNATLIMPFKATGTTSNRNNMDFYSGVLLAAREMKENGTEFHLNVFDLSAGITGIPAETLKGSDLIIGPVAPNDIEQVAALVNGECPIISPLDQRAEKLTAKYSNVIQAPSSQYSQFTDIAQWIKEDFEEGDKVIVISEKEARQNDAGMVLKSIIDRSGIRYASVSYSILEGRNIQSSIEAAMTKTGTNRVVIASDSEAFANDAVRNLNLIVHNKFNLVLYAPAKIRTFETIEVENFHNTSLHASLTYHIDYESKDVKDFILKYRAMFGAEPTQFAFQGYDIARHFIEAAAEHKEWQPTLEGKDTPMLQSNFMFRKNGQGGHTNNGVRRIIYGKDYSIKTIK